MVDRLSTGVNLLDDKLEGGIPVGSLVTVEVSPDSQYDLLIHHMVEENETVYVTTQRSKKAVTDSFERSNIRTDNLTVIEATSAESRSKTLRKAVQQLHEGATIIVDKIDEFECDSNYPELLRDIQDILITKNAVGYLYRSSGVAPSQYSYNTKGTSDVVFKLLTEIDGDEIMNRLAILKARGGPTVDELIKLNLSGEVRIDTSRDIA